MCVCIVCACIIYSHLFSCLSFSFLLPCCLYTFIASLSFLTLHIFSQTCAYTSFFLFFFFSPTPLYSSSFSSPQRCLVFYPLRFCRCTDCGNAFWAWILWSLHLMGCNRLACNSCIRSCALYLLLILHTLLPTAYSAVPCNQYPMLLYSIDAYVKNMCESPGDSIVTRTKKKKTTQGLRNWICSQTGGCVTPISFSSFSSKLCKKT